MAEKGLQNGPVFYLIEYAGTCLQKRKDVSGKYCPENFEGGKRKTVNVKGNNKKHDSRNNRTEAAEGKSSFQKAF